MIIIVNLRKSCLNYVGEIGVYCRGKRTHKYAEVSCTFKKANYIDLIFIEFRHDICYGYSYWFYRFKENFINT